MEFAKWLVSILIIFYTGEQLTGPKSDMCHFEKSHFIQKTLNHAVSKECWKFVCDQCVIDLSI